MAFSRDLGGRIGGSAMITRIRRLPARSERLRQRIGLSRRKNELDIVRLLRGPTSRPDPEAKQHAPVRVADDLQIA